MNNHGKKIINKQLLRICVYANKMFEQNEVRNIIKSLILI